MKKKAISAFAAVLIFSLTVRAVSLADDMRSPWEAPEETHYIKSEIGRAVKSDSGKRQKKDSLETNPLKLPFLWGLKFYRNFISPMDGDKCGMYPTCSDYSSRAIRKHGAVIGVMMTVDRLLHEGTEQSEAPLIEKYDRLRYYDPVENNDFWFNENK